MLARPTSPITATPRFAKAIGVVLVGAAIGMLARPLGSLAIGPCYLMLLHLAWLLLLLLGAKAVVRPLFPVEQAFWGLVMGIAAAQLIPEMLRSGRGGDSLPIATALVPSLCLVALACAASLLVHRTALEHVELPGRWRAVAIAMMFTVIVGCRVGHWICLMNGVRNEDRSLMIGDLEVHHITWSTLVLWLLVGVKQRAGRFTVPLALATAAILGSMSDEFAYMLHVGHIVENDTFYASAWSLLGAGVTCTAVAVAVGIRFGDPEKERELWSIQSKG